MIAVDIGGSHISSMHIENLESKAINNNLQRDLVPIIASSKEVILDAWSKNINRSITISNYFDGQIAIAIPGPFDYDKGIVGCHPNGKFEPLEGTNLRDELLARIEGSKHIHFENDAVSFGLGEYFYGSNESISKLMALTLGTGIGCAFIDNGMIVNDGPTVPPSGEVYLLPYKDLTADDYFSSRWFAHKAKDHGLLVIGVKELIEQGSANIVKSIFSEFSFQFFQFISIIALKFETQQIVIGGSISKCWSHFGIELDKLFKQIGIDVKQSRLGERGICLGVAKSMINAKHK